MADLQPLASVLRDPSLHSLEEAGDRRSFVVLTDDTVALLS